MERSMIKGHEDDDPNARGNLSNGILSSNDAYDSLSAHSSASIFHPVGSISILCRRLSANWKILLLGQTLSLLLASAGAAQATLHLRCGLSAPTFTMALVYLGLCVLHFPILLLRCLRRRKQHFGVSTLEDTEETENDVEVNQDPTLHSLHRPLWWYLLLAFFDVEANAITMLAFRYTTLTSVTLFDALAIPASMIISRCIVFRSTRRYRPLHYIGVIVCMVGVFLNVLQDYESDNSERSTENNYYPHKLKGDLCAITGGILYGLNDVLTEVTVSGSSGDPIEYLGLLGFFGGIISFLQSLALERADIAAFLPHLVEDTEETMASATCSTSKGFTLLGIFVGVTMLSYSGGTRFLMISEATFFNLSLLTGDLWSVVFSIFAEKIVPNSLFFAALTAVLSGVIAYEMAPSPALEKHTDERYTRPLDFQGESGPPNDGDGEIEIVESYTRNGMVRSHPPPKTDQGGVGIQDVVVIT